jgi:hypothetical protein
MRPFAGADRILRGTRHAQRVLPVVGLREGGWPEQATNRFIELTFHLQNKHA